MTSFPLHSEVHYFKSLQVFLEKSQQRSTNVKVLHEHIPPLVQELLATRQQRFCLNVLRAGSGQGK